MAFDTFFAYLGVYPSVEAALEDDDGIHALHVEAGLIDAYDAAVVEKRAGGDLKEFGEQLDAGEAGLSVVAVADMESKVEAALKRAEKIEKKELKADMKELEKEAKAAG